MKYIKSSKRIQQQTIILVFYIFLGLILVNSIIFYTRIDLTDTKMFSISKVSREIVKDAKDTVYIDYYISPKLKTATLKPAQIIDILQEYQARSQGKIVVTERDPSVEESVKFIEEYKLEPKQIQLVEQNQATYAVVYSGIVISYQEKRKIIPFLLEPAIIEYQITSKIQEMLIGDDRVVGILSLDKQYTVDPQILRDITEILKQDYTVKEISLDTRIDDDVDALFIIGAADITNDTAYYIDQFVMSGKGVYFATDSVRIEINNVYFGKGQYTLLHKLLEHYGITVDEKIVLDEYNKLFPVNQGNGIQILQPYPMWVTIPDTGVNKDSPITSRFGGLDLFWPSPLIVEESKKQYYTTLINSSPESWAIVSEEKKKDPTITKDANQIFSLYPGNNNINFYLSKVEGDGTTKEYSLVESFLGPLTSAVEAGIITKPKSVDDYKPNTDRARFIVTGNSLFATIAFRYTRATYNLVFLSGASDWLSSNEKLLSIKVRTIKNMRLNNITDAKTKKLLMTFVQFWNVIFIPFVIIIIAIIMLIIRRRATQRKYNFKN